MSHYPSVLLGTVLRKCEERERIRPDKIYKEITVRLWGKGVALRREVMGAEIAAEHRQVARAGDLILSRIDARNGAFGIVPQDLDKAIVSGDFPLFRLEPAALDSDFLSWMTKTSWFVDICKDASEGTTNRVRLKEERFLASKIPLPPVEEQRRIVGRIEEVTTRLGRARSLGKDAEVGLRDLLNAVFYQIAHGAPKRPLGEIAPLLRRPVPVELEEPYPQIAVRSFGRGTFHKPPLNGNDVTWQKLYLVKAGDILVSNIKAWEGALAVAAPEDDGRFGSHRYLTCVPVEGVATARFVCFYLLTKEGLYDVGDASPGSADRNRTLNTQPFLKIRVPVPDYSKQLWFGELCRRVDKLDNLREEVSAEYDALIPSILDKAFKGEL